MARDWFKRESTKVKLTLNHLIPNQNCKTETIITFKQKKEKTNGSLF